MDLTLKPIGVIHSPVTDRSAAAKQGSEGAPDVWIDIDPRFADALFRLKPGDDIIVLTWLHLSRRDTLQVHPRSDPDRALHGVFATRSPDRPNPVGLHRATLRQIDGLRLLVGPIEAIDGTPVIDIKPALSCVPDF